MARARLYGWNGERPVKPVSGQKQIVLFGMSEHKGEVKSGKEWAEIIGPGLATRQDPYRVVLYYILGLKKDGCIRTVEQEISAVTVNADVKHGIVVKTDSAVEETHVVPKPEVEDEAPDDADESDEENDDEGEADEADEAHAE